MRLDCLLNLLFRRRSKKTSKLRVTGLCEGSPPVTGGSPPLPPQRASNAEFLSISWRHHVDDLSQQGEWTWPCLWRINVKIYVSQQDYPDLIRHILLYSIYCAWYCTLQVIAALTNVAFDQGHFDIIPETGTVLIIHAIWWSVPLVDVRSHLIIIMCHYITY